MYKLESPATSVFRSSILPLCQWYARRLKAASNLIRHHLAAVIDCDARAEQVSRECSQVFHPSSLVHRNP